MHANELLDPDSVFRLKGSLLAVTVLELTHNSPASLEKQLAEKKSRAPGFFNDAPLVLSLELLTEQEPPADLCALFAICQQQGLLPLGIRARRECDIAAAFKAGIPLLPAGSTKERSTTEPARQTIPRRSSVPQPTKVITRSVRGGQQIYAPGGDLVVLSAVSPGAELIADGNIHAYGPMRGRILAGANGNREARIFCQQLTAELISVAGHYKVAEDLRRSPHWGQPAQISLSGDVLNIIHL